MPQLQCNWRKCNKQFYSKHSTAKYCSKKHSTLDKIKYFQFTITHTSGRQHTQKVNSKDTYVKEKEKYQDKIISYDHSPTGKAYIGFNKEPLMPVKEGFGFEGVLLQDDSRQFIQCHNCGSWLKKLSIKHINKCSNGTLDTKTYRIKYGLYMAEGLVSDETSLKLTQNALKNKKPIASYQSTLQRDEARKKSHTNESHTTRQWQNKHGNCPEQLKQRLKEFIVVNRELPSQHNRGRSLYKILCRRFGSFGKGLQYYSLPNYERRGTNYYYTFADHTIYKFNINKLYDREALINMLFQKCSLFRS